MSSKTRGSVFATLALVLAAAIYDGLILIAISHSVIARSGDFHAFVWPLIAPALLLLAIAFFVRRWRIPVSALLLLWGLLSLANSFLLGCNSHYLALHERCT
jgi:uncharacterized membrane protein YhaH (DUF805 family)